MIMDLSSPLTLLFGVLTTLALGAAAGFVLGSAVGRTQAATPLSTTLRLARERLAAASSQIERATAKLGSAERGEFAGSATGLGRRMADLSSELGMLERKSLKSREGST